MSEAKTPFTAVTIVFGTAVFASAFPVGSNHASDAGRQDTVSDAGVITVEN